MGKKRFNSAALTKNYASSSSRAHASASAPSERVELSVTDKLSKLRLEGLRHERNTVGSARPSTPVNAESLRTRGDPEVSTLLGLEYVEPVSRVKPRNPGHLAPKSWLTPVRRKRKTLKADIQKNRTGSLPSLVEIGLATIADDLESFLGCGLRYLPAYMRSYLLSSMSSSSRCDAIWNDIVPTEEVDDEITSLNLHSLRASPISLRRLSGLRKISISLSQLESGLVFATPSVLQDLSIVADFESLDQHVPTAKTQAHWRKLSSYFVALRDIQIDLTDADLIVNRTGIIALCELLTHGPDWRYAFDTVRRVSIVLDSRLTQSSCAKEYQTLISEGLRGQRRLGKHVEVLVSPYHTKVYANFGTKDLRGEVSDFDRNGTIHREPFRRCI